MLNVNNKKKICPFLNQKNLKKELAGMKNRRFKQQMGRWGRNGLILKVSSNSGILILCMKQFLYTGFDGRRADNIWFPGDEGGGRGLHAVCLALPEVCLAWSGAYALM